MKRVTPLSAEMTPEEMVELLNTIYSFYDSLTEKYGLEKIRTIGDNYMVASGVPRPRPDHAKALARMALEMCDIFKDGGRLAIDGLNFRIGINSGPLVAGVIGYKKFQYDIWGPTVNTASRTVALGSKYQEFENGRIYSHPEGAAFTLFDDLLVKYLASVPNSDKKYYEILGLPITSEIDENQPDCRAYFEKGYLSCLRDVRLVAVQKWPNSGPMALD